MPTAERYSEAVLSLDEAAAVALFVEDAPLGISYACFGRTGIAAHRADGHGWYLGFCVHGASTNAADYTLSIQNAVTLPPEASQVCPVCPSPTSRSGAPWFGWIRAPGALTLPQAVRPFPRSTANVSRNLWLFMCPLLDSFAACEDRRQITIAPIFRHAFFVTLPGPKDVLRVSVEHG